MRQFKYRLPNKKKWLLTDAFLTTFKEELDKIFEFKIEDKNPTYWNHYCWLDGTCGFYEALKITSEKHNVKKAIYEYACRLPWYHSDIFNGELTRMMCKRGIIEEGSVDEINDDYPTKEQLLEWEENGEIEWIEEIIRHSGCYTTRRDWHFVEKENHKL